ncbi:hypothetical protein ACLB2K_031611 [Fragaria x ananassa]
MCKVNGVQFICEQRDSRRRTQNYGVMAHGGRNGVDYYGVLDSVVELVYGQGMTVHLFKCRWFDTRPQSMKNELRTHWTTHGNARSGTPAEFQYREYEWRWLLTSEFNNPRGFPGERSEPATQHKEPVLAHVLSGEAVRVPRELEIRIPRGHRISRGIGIFWTKSSSRAAGPRHPSWAKKATGIGPNAIQNLSRVLDRKYPLGSNRTIMPVLDISLLDILAIAGLPIHAKPYAPGDFASTEFTHVCNLGARRVLKVLTSPQGNGPGWPKHCIMGSK